MISELTKVKKSIVVYKHHTLFPVNIIGEGEYSSSGDVHYYLSGNVSFLLPSNSFFHTGHHISSPYRKDVTVSYMNFGDHCIASNGIPGNADYKHPLAVIQMEVYVFHIKIETQSWYESEPKLDEQVVYYYRDDKTGKWYGGMCIYPPSVADDFQKDRDNKFTVFYKASGKEMPFHPEIPEHIFHHFYTIITNYECEIIE